MVKRATTCLLLCLVVLTVMAAKKKQPAISVTDLRTERMTAPMSIDTPIPGVGGGCRCAWGR